MPDAETPQGHVVSGRYRLVKRLGEGGMGAVWLADHVTLRSKVAVKLLHPALLDTDEGERRFLREAQAAALLRSPHVVQILDHGVDGGIPYIVMELLEGESLAARLARVKRLSLPETARLVTHLARAVGKAHDAGIVHRDLKPDNVFIVHNDDEEVAKVLDFGIAKMASPLLEPAAQISTREGSILGTPLYMSPEQVRGYGVDWRSDLWSLAVIAFECACGRGPFAKCAVGDLLVRICSDPLPVPSALAPLPPSFDAWFAKAASREVEKRFQSAKEMAEALRAISGEAPRTASFGAPPEVGVAGGEARGDPSVAGAETTDRLSPDAAVRETNRLSPDPAHRGDPDPAADTARLEEDPGTDRAEHPATLASGGTMAGSATSPAVSPQPRSLRAASVVAVVLVACVIGVAAWLGLAGRGSVATVGSTTEGPPPIPPTEAREPPRSPRLAPAAPAEPSTTASAPPSAASSDRVSERVSPSAAGAPPGPQTDATAHGSVPRPHASSSAAPRTPPHASDELTF